MTMETPTQHEIDENIRNFERGLTAILSEPYTLNIEHNDEGLPDKASIYTRETIDTTQIDLLEDHADNWNLKLTFSATDTGRLSINF
ncbi:MAG: hypothetical protein CMF32_01630 [Leeuwenhoekiella sp.]|nr:hypothetical protein [Leeuwenhoekiella sp.]